LLLLGRIYTIVCVSRRRLRKNPVAAKKLIARRMKPKKQMIAVLMLRADCAIIVKPVVLRKL
jgi:hypothetical protein